MISNINSQPLDNSAVETNKNSTAQTANTSQSSLKEPVEKSAAASPATIVRLGAANAGEPPVTYSFSRSTGVVTPPPTQASLEYSAAGTSGNIGKPPPTQTQQSLEFETQGTSGGIGKPPPTPTEPLEVETEGTSGGIGKPPP